MHPEASSTDTATGILHPRSFGSSTADPSLAPAADASALVMVALIFFLLGCFAAWGFALYKRSLRPRPWHADLTEPDPESSKPVQPDKLAAWERQADWWK